MKQLFSVCLVLILSIVLINCGSETEKPDSEKAKELIFKEIDAVVEALKGQKKGDLTNEAVKETEDKVEKFKEGIDVLGVQEQEEGRLMIAKVNVNIGEKTNLFFLKFNKYDTGWQLEFLKGSDDKWVTKSRVIETALKRVKGKLFITKQETTMGDMKSLGNVIEAYLTDAYKAPQAANLDELEKLLVPFYTKVIVKKDAWGNDYHYYHGEEGSNEQDIYAVGSGGRDGKFEGFERAASHIGVSGKGDDIIFSNGNFTSIPKGN